MTRYYTGCEIWLIKHRKKQLSWLKAAMTKRARCGHLQPSIDQLFAANLAGACSITFAIDTLDL